MLRYMNQTSALVCNVIISNTNNDVGLIHSSFPCSQPRAIIEVSKESHKNRLYRQGNSITIVL